MVTKEKQPKDEIFEQTDFETIYNEKMKKNMQNKNTDQNKIPNKFSHPMIFDAKKIKSTDEFLKKFDKCGVDIGNSPMMYITTESGLQLTVSKKTFYKLSHLYRNNDKLEMINNANNIKKVYEELSLTSTKVSDTKEYMKYVEVIRKNWQEIWKHNESIEILSLKFDTFISRQRALTKMAKEIVAELKNKSNVYDRHLPYFDLKKFEENAKKPILLAMGTGNGNVTICNTRNSGPKGPIHKLINELAKYCIVVLTPEYKTSQICCLCHKQTNDIYTYKFPNKNKINELELLPKDHATIQKNQSAKAENNIIKINEYNAIPMIDATNNIDNKTKIINKVKEINDFLSEICANCENKTSHFNKNEMTQITENIQNFRETNVNTVDLNSDNIGKINKIIGRTNVLIYQTNKILKKSFDNNAILNDVNTIIKTIIDNRKKIHKYKQYEKEQSQKNYKKNIATLKRMGKKLKINDTDKIEMNDLTIKIQKFEEFQKYINDLETKTIDMGFYGKCYGLRKCTNNEEHGKKGIIWERNHNASINILKMMELILTTGTKGYFMKNKTTKGKPDTTKLEQLSNIIKTDDNNGSIMNTKIIVKPKKLPIVDIKNEPTEQTALENIIKIDNIKAIKDTKITVKPKKLPIVDIKNEPVPENIIKIDNIKAIKDTKIIVKPRKRPIADAKNEPIEQTVLENIIKINNNGALKRPENTSIT